MIEKFTQFLTNRIRKEMPDIDDERAEVINYGLQVILGEIPKIFIMLAIAYILGVFKLTLLTFLILLPYRATSGGFHLKTHIGCIVSTSTFYCGTAILAKYVLLEEIVKYSIIIPELIFGIIMIKLYAPADTENLPILRHKDRLRKQILSYIFFVIGLAVAAITKNNIIANIIIFGYLVQTLMITKLAYRLTNNKYGYEVYINTSEQMS